MKSPLRARAIQSGNINASPCFDVYDVESELARIKQLEPPRISEQVVTVEPFRLFQFSDTEGNILECFTRS